MNPPIVLLEAAAMDLTDARDWYCQCHPCLETDLVLCVEEALERIARDPFAHAALEAGFRRAFVRRFPYGIVYHSAPDRITVIAILHTSRHPLTWQGRGH